MNLIKMSVHMLLQSFKNHMYYVCMILFVTMISFLFSHITENPYLLYATSTGNNNVPLIAVSRFVIFIIIAFAVSLAIYAYTYLLTKKSNELKILKVSGGSLKKIGIFLFIQNMVMMIIVTIVGIILGAIITPLINYIIYNFLDIHAKYIDYNMHAIITTIQINIMILIATTLLGIGHVYRNEITNLSEAQSDWTKDKRMIKFPTASHIFLYLAGIIMFVTSKEVTGAAIAFSIIGCCGASGIIRIKLCEKIKQLNQEKYHEDKIKNISRNNLIYSLKKGNFVILGLLFCSTVMLSWSIATIENPSEFIISLIAYIISILLLLSSTLCRYLVDLEKRNQEFKLLYKIGYSYHDIKSIITREITDYYIVIVAFSIIYILLIFLHPLIYGRLSILTAIAIFMFYIISICMTTIITIKISINSIKQELKG